MIALGLDGATFSLIEPWVEPGHLSNFERLLEGSVSGALESTVPAIMVPAWPAFATGRDPTELDMYGFTHFNRGTRENDLSHDEFVPGKMWDAVDDHGGSAVESITGDVLNVFADGSDPAERDPETYDFAGADAVTSGGGGVAGDEEKEDEVKDRLRELGYLE